jgi:phospholipid/cholesterol/gamma-HCH transport system permease protein
MRSNLLDMMDGVGQVTLNHLKSFSFIVRGRIKVTHVIEQASQIGFDSLGIVFLINFISGAVLALNAVDKFAMTGATHYVGALVALATVREMGPMFTAFAMSARSGTAMSAEIGNMSVSNQIDALKILHISPWRYLMAPRVLACMLVLPCMTILGDVFGILGGMVTARYVAFLNERMFLDSIWLILKPYDLFVSLLKAVIFSLLIGGIAVTAGLNAKGGARFVGLATTHATVWSAISIIIADFFLTWIFFGTRLSV